MFHKTVLSQRLKTGRCSTQSHSMSCILNINRKHLPRSLPPHCPLLNYNSHDATVIRSQRTVVKALCLSWFYCIRHILLCFQWQPTILISYFHYLFSISYFMSYLQWKREKRIITTIFIIAAEYSLFTVLIIFKLCIKSFWQILSTPNLWTFITA